MKITQPVYRTWLGRRGRVREVRQVGEYGDRVSVMEWQDDPAGPVEARRMRGNARKGTLKVLDERTFATVDEAVAWAFRLYEERAR